MVAPNFQSKWCPWQLKLCYISAISLLARILNMVKIGLKLMKLHLEVAVFMNFISNFTLFYLNTPVQVYMHTEIYAY